MKRTIVLISTALGFFSLAFGTASAQVVPTCGAGTFDTFVTGTVNGQGGWSATNPAIDQEVATNTFGFTSLGCKVLRISNASTSQIIVGQVFSNVANAQAGELQALDSNGATGTPGRPNRFEAQFDLASVTQNEQPGLHLSVSPDRGDGTRMGALGFVDTAAGIDVFATDVSGTTNPVTFTDTQIATALSRATPHTIRYVMDFNEGQGNDVSQIFIDGNLVHTGSSWENFYRFDNQAFPAPNASTSRTVSKLVFYEQAPAATTTQFNGFLIGNVSLLATSTTATSTSTTTPPSSSSTVPVITLNGSSTIDVILGSIFTDPGATAVSGTTTVPVTATGTVNTSVIGAYIITYTATSSLNEVATTSRTVNVVASSTSVSTSTIPIITLNGSSTMNIFIGSVFTDPGATATSGTTTVPVTATGTVDTSILGSNIILYTATSSLNEVATTSRTVNVVSTSTPPTITLNGSSTISITQNSVFTDPGATASDAASSSLSVNATGTVNTAVVGSYLIIYTATSTFNQVATTTRTVNVVAVSSGVSTGGGGSGGGYFIFAPLPGPTSNTPGVPTAGLPPISVGILTTPTGQVLGAVAFNFTRNLRLGSRGDDVTELQKYLISQGYLVIVTPTRYFGKATQNALKKWQKKMNLPATGYFGPMSRATILK